jgi:spermidine/putrescine transport system substrate-binding protein
MAALRVLCWPGMPAGEALAEAAVRAGVQLEVTVISSNEDLEADLAASPFDLVFPSDYLVERLAGRGALLELDLPAVVLGRLAGWAREAPHDPGCRWSLPFAFGTTGYLCDARLGPADSWRELLAPAGGMRVGMLSEVREVVGAALLAAGRSPNDVSPAALDAARALLLEQRPRVARYNSDDFIGPVVSGEVSAHQAWSGPAAAAVREHPGLHYVIPAEGAVLWVTTGALPIAAPDPEGARRLLLELADPALAAQTTLRNGYATPSKAARALLPVVLREDRALFPSEATVRRCTALHDLGADEARLEALFGEVVAAG